MDYVRLGSSGLKVSKMCLGCQNFGGPTDEAESKAILEEAIEAGMIFWDTANIDNNGRSEEIIGKVLKETGWRDQIVLATKVGGKTGTGPNDGGNKRRHIMLEVDRSLKRLQTDWIDIYQIQRPDNECSLDETLDTMGRLITAGKIRYIGTSMFSTAQLVETWWRGGGKSARPISEQLAYNILDRRAENERLTWLRSYSVATLAYSPLAGGMLSGKYYEHRVTAEVPKDSRMEREDKAFTRHFPDRALRIADQIVDMSKNHGCTASQFALAWLLQRPITCPVIGPRTRAQFKDNIAALKVKLTKEEIKRIDELVPPGMAVADFHDTAPWYVGRVI